MRHWKNYFNTLNVLTFEVVKDLRNISVGDNFNEKPETFEHGSESSSFTHLIYFSHSDYLWEKIFFLKLFMVHRNCMQFSVTWMETIPFDLSPSIQ